MLPPLPWQISLYAPTQSQLQKCHRSKKGQFVWKKEKYRLITSACFVNKLVSYSLTFGSAVFLDPKMRYFFTFWSETAVFVELSDPELRYLLNFRIRNCGICLL